MRRASVADGGAPAQRGGGQASGIQRLVVALAVLVVLGVAGTNARLVMQFMANQQATIAGAWQGEPTAALNRPSSVSTGAHARAGRDAQTIRRFVSKVRSGELHLLGETREHLQARLRSLGFEPRPGDSGPYADLLDLPISSLLRNEAPRESGTGAFTPGGVGGEVPLPAPVGKATTPLFTTADFAQFTRQASWEMEEKPAVSSTPPTLDDALAKIPKPNNTVIATFVNLKRFDFGLTWVRRAEKLGLKNVVVGALDPSALTKLSAAGVATFLMGVSAQRSTLPGASDYGWNSPNFKKMGIEKVQLLHDLLSRNLSALLMDADAVLISNPLPFFARYPEADLLVTTDYIGAPTTDGNLDLPAHMHITMNIGVIFAKKTAGPLASAWLKRLSTPGQLSWDQNVFFELMSSKKGGAAFADHPGKLQERLTPAMKEKRLGLAFDATIVAGILPTSLFCTGFTFVSGYCNKVKNQTPFTFHACWLFYEALGKRVRLRSLRLWHDDKSYYERGDGDRTQGFLYLADGGWLARPSVELLTPPFTVDKHMRLVHEQLVHVRSGMLLAAALKRQFVMPRMLCLYDKWWAEHNGTIPVAVMDQPIQDCPMDHLLNLQYLDKHQQWLPRQHTFVDHDDMPTEVKASRVNVSLSAFHPNNSSRGQPSFADLVDVLSPPAAHLASTPNGHPSAARILGVSNIPDVFRMLHKDDQTTFQSAAKHFTSLMCCTFSPKLNGHIHYDLFWDIIPHEDLFRRTFTKEWVPLFAETRQRLTDCSFDWSKARDAAHPVVTCGKDPRPI